MNNRDFEWEDAAIADDATTEPNEEDESLFSSCPMEETLANLERLAADAERKRGELREYLERIQAQL